MKYTYDTIPAKLFFHALETKDFSEVTAENINAINEVRGAGEQGKLSYEMNLHAQMEALLARYNVVKYSIYHLRQKYDADLVEILKGMRYNIGDDLQKSLDAIEKLTEGLLVRINSIKNRLPEKEEVESESVPLDEVILSYCALLDMGFVDTNSVTLSQYDSLIKLGNKRMETLRKSEDGRK